ncbi:MAG TPA: phosphate-starvation-inducible PsiE family protein, partial [Ktedonobacterales bacterium]|nr:phosphate-starvation-inducible PsiE family protein [Ktedonobacterales bacterium]
VPGTPPHREVKGIRLAILRLLNGLDLVVYALVGVAFVAAAILAFAFSIGQVIFNLLFSLGIHFNLYVNYNDIATAVLDFVSDLLLVLIIMELLGTIRSYVEKGDTSVEPFLVIGIISATRGILSVGARLYITGATLHDDEFRNAMIELAINALVIIALGITMRILNGLSAQPDGRHTASQRADGVPVGDNDGPATTQQLEPTS